MVWLVQQLAILLGITIVWIFLESGHGKGIPDGIGAVVKRAIKDLIQYNPDVPLYTVDDFIAIGLQQCLPSIYLYKYTEEQVSELKTSFLAKYDVIGEN